MPTQDKFDLQSRRHQARSEDTYPEPAFPAPTFPTFPKSSTEGFDFQSRRHQARSEDTFPEPTFPAPTFPTFPRSSSEGLDFQSRRHQARSEDAYSEPEFKNPISSMREDFEIDARRNQASSEDTFSEPTFYTNQRYSEIAKPNSVRTESQFQPFPDKLRDMIDEKKSKLENYAYDYEMGENFGADFETPKFDNQKYSLPYESQSIRRLDGPFDPFESELNSEPETSSKGRLIKVKVKKPVMSRSGEAKEDSYNGEKETYTAEKPNWRLPIQPIDPVEKPDYYDPPDREITVGYYEPPARKVSDLNFYEPPPPKEEALNFYQPPPQRQRYTAPSYTVKSNPSRVPYKARTRDRLYQTTTRTPTTYAPRTTYQPKYEEPQTTYKPFYEESNFVKRRQDKIIEEKPSIFSDEAFKIPQYKPLQNPPYKPRQSYEKEPSFKERSFNKDIIQDRQSINTQPNFLDEPFEIPSFFRSNFDEPAFAQFNPPFGASGMFVDFLKTIGEGDEQVPFSQPQLRTYVEDAPKLRTDSDIFQRYGSSYDTEEIGGSSPRWFSSNYKSERPSPNNGYFANDYIQDYGVKTTTTPKPTTTTTTPTETPKQYYDFKPIIPENPKPTYKIVEEPKPIEESKPTYKPVKETSYRPVEEPNQRPGPPYKSKYVSTYKPPKKYQPKYKPLKEPVIIPPSSTYNPVREERPSNTYREPIQQKPAYKAETTTSTPTPKPTESEVYYKSYDNEEHTPGPVYYKPLEESEGVTEATEIISPTTIPPPQTDTDSVATAPKAPPPKRKLKLKKKLPPQRPPKRKKPFLKFPKLKFPKLPRAQPLQRRTKPAPVKKPLPPPNHGLENKRAEPHPSQSVANQRAEPRPPQSVANKRVEPRPQISGPGQARKGQLPPQQRKHNMNLLGKVKQIFSGHKRFLKNREGSPIAQSTAVLLPYVMSLIK